MLGLFGAEDRAVPAALAESFEARLTEAGLPHEIAIYLGQPHGFFEWHHLGPVETAVGPGAVPHPGRRILSAGA